MTKWVYADGTVGLRDFDPKLPVYRSPRLRQGSLEFTTQNPDDLPSFDYDEYAQCGLTFEGERLYVHSTFEVKKLGNMGTFSAEIPNVRDFLRLSVQTALGEYVGRQIVLLSEQFADPSTPDDREELLSARMFALAYRLLIAVKKA